jgi:hypothetical protein
MTRVPKAVLTVVCLSLAGAASAGTRTGAVRVYISPQGNPFQPVQDTNAFATCP